MHTLPLHKCESNIHAKKSLSKPERQKPNELRRREFMLRDMYENVPNARIGATSSRSTSPTNNNTIRKNVPLKAKADSWWARVSRIMTFFCCSCCLVAMGKKDRIVQQAWREKVALCMIIVFMNVIVMAYTLGSSSIPCDYQSNPNSFYYYSNNRVIWRSDVTINGYIYDFNQTAYI